MQSAKKAVNTVYQSQQSNPSQSEKLFPDKVNAVAVSRQPFTNRTKNNQQQIELQIDAGDQANILPENIFMKLQVIPDRGPNPNKPQRAEDFNHRHMKSDTLPQQLKYRF